MLKIGEFSKMSKVTIKALRYYEKEGLFRPARIDEQNGYRYYENSQLLDISKIVALRQIGFSIEEIKKVVEGEPLERILNSKKQEIESSIFEQENKLQKINYFLKEKDMKEEIFEKLVPSHFVYYAEGILKSYQEVSNLILNSGEECMKLNPGIKCVEPDYCYVEYLDGEYKEKDIKVRYSQAVIKSKKPFNENDIIKFAEIPETKCVCIYHKGAYDNLSESYGKIMKYIEENGMKIANYPRERYIDGIWNKNNEEDWLTEIQVPIK